MEGGGDGGRRAAGSEQPERPPFSAYRLPPGRHGIPPEQVAENQRWRLLGAAAEVLAERGYAQIRGRDVCRRAGVSQTTFYEHFEGLEDCLLAAFEMAAACIMDLLPPACEGEDGADALSDAIEATLRFLGEEPALAHLLGPEAAAAIPPVAAARERLVDGVSGAGVERHRVEGALTLACERAATVDARHLSELAPQLVELIVPCWGATDGVR